MWLFSLQKIQKLHEEFKKGDKNMKIYIVQFSDKVIAVRQNYEDAVDCAYIYWKQRHIGLTGEVPAEYRFNPDFYVSEWEAL